MFKRNILIIFLEISSLLLQAQVDSNSIKKSKNAILFAPLNYINHSIPNYLIDIVYN